MLDLKDSMNLIYNKLTSGIRQRVSLNLIKQFFFPFFSKEEPFIIFLKILSNMKYYRACQSINLNDVILTGKVMILPLLSC